jgi:hypothetical protein
MLVKVASKSTANGVIAPAEPTRLHAFLLDTNRVGRPAIAMTALPSLFLSSSITLFERLFCPADDTAAHSHCKPKKVEAPNPRSRTKCV